MATFSADVSDYSFFFFFSFFDLRRARCGTFFFFSRLSTRRRWAGCRRFATKPPPAPADGVDFHHIALLLGASRVDDVFAHENIMNFFRRASIGACWVRAFRTRGDAAQHTWQDSIGECAIYLCADCAGSAVLIDHLVVLCCSATYAATAMCAPPSP